MDYTVPIISDIQIKLREDAVPPLITDIAIIMTEDDMLIEGTLLSSPPAPESFYEAPVLGNLLSLAASETQFVGDGSIVGWHNVRAEASVSFSGDLSIIGWLDTVAYGADVEMTGPSSLVTESPAPVVSMYGVVTIGCFLNTEYPAPKAVFDTVKYITGTLKVVSGPGDSSLSGLVGIVGALRSEVQPPVSKIVAHQSVFGSLRTVMESQATFRQDYPDGDIIIRYED